MIFLDYGDDFEKRIYLASDIPRAVWLQHLTEFH